MALRILLNRISSSSILHRTTNRVNVAHGPLSTTNLKLEEKKDIKITFIKANGEKIIAHGAEGDSILDVVKDNNLDFEGYGACDGTLSCSTCHVIMTQNDYDKFAGRGVEENDMIELSKDFTETSRLGCQVLLRKDLHEIELKLPAMVTDVRNSA